MQEPSPLEKLASEFAAWRSSGLDSKATPLPLRQRAVELKSSHCVSHILSALKVNHSTLKRWSADQTITPAPEFIALPTVPPLDVDARLVAADVLCELPNGIRLTLNSQALTHAFLSTLSRINTEAPS